MNATITAAGGRAMRPINAYPRGEQPLPVLVGLLDRLAQA